MRVRSLLKPLLAAPFLWGVSILVSADVSLPVHRSIEPVEISAQAQGGLTSAIPVYFSDQGTVVRMGSRVVLLEGLHSNSWWWLVSQMGIHAVSQMLFNAVSMQFYNNENKFLESNAGYGRQYLMFGVAMPALALTAFARNLWRNYNEGGLWAVFADISVGNLWAGDKKNAFKFASYSAIAGVASYIKYKCSEMEYGQQQVYLSGLEAANLLARIDYDNSTIGNTRMTFSRIKGAPVKDRNNSEFSALSFAMDLAGVSSVHVETVSPSLESDGYFALAYKGVNGVSNAVRFNVGGKPKPWLMDLLHSRIDSNELGNSRTILSPAGISIVAQWLESSVEDDVVFQPGTVELSIGDQQQKKNRVFIFDTTPLGDVTIAEDGSLVLGHKYNLSIADGHLWSSRVLTIPTTRDEQYTQYRVPNWVTQFMLTQSTRMTTQAVRKGVNFAMEKVYSDGWKMADLNKALADGITEHGAIEKRIASRMVHRDELNKAQQVLFDNYPKGRPQDDVQKLLSDDNVDRLTKAYRQISRQLHPDKFAGEEQSVIDEATKSFQKVNKANEILEWFLSNKNEINVIDANSPKSHQEIYRALERMTRHM